MIRELLDGMKSRLKGVGEKASEVPPPGGLPPAPTDISESTADAAAPTMPEPAPSEDFTALLGGGDTSELDNKVKALEDKSTKLESTLKETLDIAKTNKERLDSIDTNMKKFISLYELVTNQINPFVDSKPPFQKAQVGLNGEAVPESESEPETIVMPSAEELGGEPPTLEMPSEEPAEAAPEEPPVLQMHEPVAAPGQKPAPPMPKVQDEGEQVMFMQSIKDGSASFVLEWITSLVSENGDLEKNTKLLKYLLNLGWITPKAYEALMQHLQILSQARKTVQPEPRIPLAVGVPSAPLGLPQAPGSSQAPPFPMKVSPENSMESLVAVLEWVKYLVDKVGYGEASEILKYLVQLEWITPEAHTALLKYIEDTIPRGVKPDLKAPLHAQDAVKKIVLSPNQIPSPTEFLKKHPEYQIPIQPSPEPAIQPQPPMQQPFSPPMPFARSFKPKAAAIIPLTDLGSDIDSLAIVLEWIRYLVDRAGTQGAKEIFNYYMNIGWVDQQVYQQLVKYVEGIKVAEEETVGYQPTIEDHATSLFFIGKLKRMDLSEDDVRSLLGK